MSQSRAPGASDQDASGSAASAAGPRPFEDLIRRRVIAWMLDAAILVILAWVIGGGAVMLSLLTLGFAGGLLLLPWGMALPILYATLSVASPLSSTPGQALMRLVVRSEGDGGHPTLGQAFTAATLHALSWAAGGLPLLAPLFSDRSRTLHDLFSGTLVMRADALAEVAPRVAPMAASAESSPRRGGGRFLAEDG